MSDEKNPGVVSIPAAEYEALKSDALRYYGQAESAGREAASLRAERDGEFITRVVRAAAEGAGALPESFGDIVAMVGPELRVENGEVKVKGQPESGVVKHAIKFLEARPHWVQSPKTNAPGRPSTPSTPGANTGFVTGVPMPAALVFNHTAESPTYMARALTYPGGRVPGGSR